MKRTTKVPKETAATAKREIKYMKKGGAPKSLVEHEKREMKAMKKKPAKRKK